MTSSCCHDTPDVGSTHFNLRATSLSHNRKDCLSSVGLAAALSAGYFAWRSRRLTLSLTRPSWMQTRQRRSVLRRPVALTA